MVDSDLKQGELQQKVSDVASAVDEIKDVLKDLCSDLLARKQSTYDSKVKGHLAKGTEDFEEDLPTISQGGSQFLDDLDLY